MSGVLIHPRALCPQLSPLNPCPCPHTGDAALKPVGCNLPRGVKALLGPPLKQPRRPAGEPRPAPQTSQRSAEGVSPGFQGQSHKSEVHGDVHKQAAGTPVETGMGALGDARPAWRLLCERDLGPRRRSQSWSQSWWSRPLCGPRLGAHRGRKPSPGAALPRGRRPHSPPTVKDQNTGGFAFTIAIANKELRRIPVWEAAALVTLQWQSGAARASCWEA